MIGNQQLQQQKQQEQQPQHQQERPRLNSMELLQKRKSAQLQFNKYIIQKDLNYHQTISQQGGSVDADDRSSKPSIMSLPVHTTTTLQQYKQQLMPRPTFVRLEQVVQLPVRQITDPEPELTINSEVSLLPFDDDSIHEQPDYKADNPFSASYKNSSLFLMSRSELPQIEPHLKMMPSQGNIIIERSQDEIEYSNDPDFQSLDQQEVQSPKQLMLLASLKDSSELKDVSHMHSSMLPASHILLEQSKISYAEQQREQRFQELEVQDLIQFEERDDDDDDDQEPSHQQTEQSIDSQDKNYPIQQLEQLVESKLTNHSRQSNDVLLQQSVVQIEKVSECQSEQQSSPVRGHNYDPPEEDSITQAQLHYSSHMIIFEQQQEDSRSEAPLDDNYSYSAFRATFQSVQKKLTDELYVDHDEFGRSSLMMSVNRTMLHALASRYADVCERQERLSVVRQIRACNLSRSTLQEWALRYADVHQGETVRRAVEDLKLLHRVVALRAVRHQGLLRAMVSAMQVNMQNQRVKNYYGMLVRKYKFRHVELHKRAIFYELKCQVELQARKLKVVNHCMKRHKLKSLLIALKMHTYLQKANRQMDSYYKGVLYRAWERVVRSQARNRDIKSLSYFYFSLVGRTFLRWKTQHKQIKREKALFFRAKRRLQMRKKALYFGKFKQATQIILREKSFNNPDLVRLAIKVQL